MNQIEHNQRPTRTLTRSTLIAAVVLLAVALIVIWLSIEANHEPVYQGKPLSYWIRRPPSWPLEDDPAGPAIIAIGTNAVPHLDKRIRVKETVYEKSRRLLDPKLPAFALKILPPAPSAEQRRQAAASALFGLGKDATAALPGLRAALTNSSARVVDTAVMCICELGPPAECIPDLIGSRPALSAHAQGRLWEALGRVADRAPSSVVPALVRALDDSFDAQLGAASALNRLKFPVPEAVAKLSKRLRNLGEGSTNELDYWAVTLGLGCATKSDRDLIPLLQGATNHPSPRVKVCALYALWKVSNEPTSSVTGLIGLLESPLAAFDAAGFLGRIGPLAREAVPPLKWLIQKERQNGNGLMLLVVAEALWRITHETDSSLAVVIELLGHKERWVREEAVAVLGRMGAPARPAIPALESALNDRYRRVRWQAAEAIQKIKDDSSRQ